MKFNLTGRRMRTLLNALGLSLIGSVIGLSLYLAPLDKLTYLNRVADYVFINDAVTAASNAGVYQKLHIPAPDLEAIDDNVVLVKIDEESIGSDPGQVGPWPWPRHVYGDALKILHEGGAKVVVFDLDFLENSANPTEDARFAAGMRMVPTILPLTVATTSTGIPFEEPTAPDLAPWIAARGFTTVDNPGGLLMGQPLNIDAPATSDAAARHWVSLVAAALQVYSKKKIATQSPWRATFGDSRVPLDGTGRFLLLPFQEAARIDISQRVGAAVSTVNFVQTTSFNKLLQFDTATARIFAKNKIVVIGPTAQGLGDFILTPLGRFPGVYSNLRMIDQLLTHKEIARVPEWIDIGLIIFLPLLLAFVGTQFSPGRGSLFAFASIMVYALISISMWAIKLVWLDLTQVSGAMLLATLFVALYRTVTEGADKRMIRDMFGAHVSPAIVDDILKNDDPKSALALQGKRVKATIFYSDIRGFTSMSEKMTPEQIYGQLNEYFEEMCAIIFKYGGYVDKFIGDCVMAVFSAPNPKPDDAKSAVLAAVEQQEKIRELGARWAKEGRQIFTVGMGCNTGDVVMGNLGSSNRMNYTVIGDNVNTAARLYNVAKGGEIIISESTYEEVKDIVEVDELEPVTVKGKEKPLRIFNVKGRKQPAAAPVQGEVLAPA